LSEAAFSEIFTVAYPATNISAIPAKTAIAALRPSHLKIKNLYP
jgi:hypothetical protein